MAKGTVLIVGGTQGLGLRLAQRFAADGHAVVISGRSLARAEQVADAIEVAGENTRPARAVAFDLAEPETIGAALESIDDVGHVVLAAIERDVNSVKDYSVERAIRLATLKLVGYTEVIHALHTRLHDDSSVLLFGGLAKDKPYPGSTTVTAVNGAVTTMVRTLAIELAPIRVNALHPGIVGDSPAWVDNQAVLDAVIKHTPTGRLITMDEVTDAALFLLRNRAVNGVNLAVDGGWVLL